LTDADVDLTEHTLFYDGAFRPLRSDAAYCYTRSSAVGLSVRLCVCLLVTFVSPAKTAEPIEMRFGAGSGGPKKSWSADPQGEGAILGVIRPI